VKLVLKKPVVLDPKAAPISELTFREEVVAGDLRGIRAKALADPEFDDLLKIAARLCGQPAVVMNALGLEDFGRVTEAVAGFLSGGQPTGTERSPS
jgi:hypothetical protein